MAILINQPALEPIIFRPKPTVREMILCPAENIVLVSDRGGGKTSGCLWSHLHWAVEHHTKDGMPLPVRYAVIRDTAVNLGRTVAKTIRDWFPEGEGSFFRGKVETPDYCLIKDPTLGPLLEFYFIGCDHPEKLSIFQSFEIGGLWVQEPAPAGTESVGIAPEFFAMAVSSSRQNKFFRAVIEFNHPPPDHWVCQLWPGVLRDPDALIAGRSIPPATLDRFAGKSAVFIIPPEENAAEAKIPGYRQRMEDTFLMIGRPDLAARLVHGIVTDVQVGEPVTPEFDEALFVVPQLAPVRSGDRLVASWDGGHSPACVIWRPRGGLALEILAAFQAEHAGMRQFIQNDVLPWLAAHVPDGVGWQHTGDPNLKTGDMGNSEQSALSVILELLPPAQPYYPGSAPTVREGRFMTDQARGPGYHTLGGKPDLATGAGWIMGPVSMHEREEPVHELLAPHWRPRIQIDRRYCRPLIRALNGGWRRKKDAAGHMIAADWVKNLMANTAEAFAYGAALFVKRRGGLTSMDAWRAKMKAQTQPFAVGGGTNV